LVSGGVKLAQLSTTIKKYRRPDIGSMNSRIFIYDRAITPPALNSLNFTETFTAKLKCWSLIETPKGVNIFDQSNIERTVTHRFIIRNVPPTSKVDVYYFSGIVTDLNDLLISGTYTFTSNLNYRVQIDSIGAVDTFKWSSDGGSTWNATGILITGLAQLLSNGVSVTFGHITGHTLGNYWDVNAISGIKISSQDWIFYQNQFMNVQSIYDILSVETLDEEGRYLSLLAALTGDQGIPANYA
jgi:hypothetical protein